MLMPNNVKILTGLLQNSKPEILFVALVVVETKEKKDHLITHKVRLKPKLNKYNHYYLTIV